MSTVPVWLFVPNLIGYLRVVTGLGAFYFALDEKTFWYFFYLYGFSYALDALDGVAARKLNQTSLFGGLLDMITDRFCTAGLLAVLATLHKDYFVHFIFLMILDIVSHWTQMFSSLSSGASSHKTMKDEHMILRFYYSFPVLFWVCVFNELCLAMLFLCGHETPGDSWLQYTITPFSFLAPVWNSIFTADVPVHRFFLYISFPVFVFKQICSVIQLATAVTRILALDEMNRKEAAVNRIK